MGMIYCFVVRYKFIQWNVFIVNRIVGIVNLCIIRINIGRQIEMDVKIGTKEELDFVCLLVGREAGGEMVNGRVIVITLKMLFYICYSGNSN